MVMQGWTDLGSLASYLVFVRQTTMPINQFTQQGNFLLAALAGAERIFTAMEEDPEVDEGTVDLVTVREAPDGTLTECADGEAPAAGPGVTAAVPACPSSRWKGMCGSTTWISPM